LQTKKIFELKPNCLIAILCICCFSAAKAQLSADSLQYLPKRVLYSKVTLIKNTVPPSFYSDKLGFFCKEELKLEKKIKIPFRFRLGSLNYVNQLEGKRY
jgi:hypothetical protein